MENYKVLVNNEAESREVQDLFFELGGDFYFGGKLHCNTHSRLVTINKDGLMANLEFDSFDYVEITLQQLRDLVVLKRNDVFDANYESENGDRKYYLTDTEFFKFINDTWVNIDELTDEMSFKFINKEVEVKMKEYLVKTDSGSYLYTKNVGDITFERVIEVPEGAEIFLLDESSGKDTLYFVKHDGEVFHEYYIDATCVPNIIWIKGTIKVLHEDMGKVLWQRNHTTTLNTLIQDDLKSINKEVEVKIKDYLFKNMYGEYRLTNHHSVFNVEDLIKVPEGAEEYRADRRFYKNNGKLFYTHYEEWVESGLTNYESLWKRNNTTSNTSIQDKLKFIEKWLNGEKIQYILGVESEKTQWHNFTEGAMQYIKRSDIKFREAPKYVTINGIEFKSVESLLKHVKNNFDLDDGSESNEF